MNAAALPFAAAPAASASWFRRWRAARAQVRRLHALAIATGTTRELPLPPGRATIHCRRGQLWLTRDGELRDMILCAGDHHVVERPGPRLTVHALESDGVVEIEWEQAA